MTHLASVAVGAVVGSAAGWLEPAIMGLVALFGAVGGLACSLAYRRYFAILGAGASPRGSAEREAYNSLRASLTEGNKAAQLCW